MSMFKLIAYITILFSLILTPLGSTAQTKKRDANLNIFEAIGVYQRGSTEEAKKYLLKYAAKEPGNDVVNYYLSNIYLREGDYSNALIYIQKAYSTDPGNYWYMVQLARLYTATKEYGMAADIYDKIRSTYPQKTTLYDDLIDLYVQQKEYTKAASVIDEIEKIEGKSEASVLTRYNILVYEGKSDLAKDLITEYNSDSPTPRTSTILGDIYLNQRSDSLAYIQYTNALKADPSYNPARFGISEYYRIKGDFAQYFENINPFLADSNMNPDMKISYLKEILRNSQFVQAFIKQLDTMMLNTYNAHKADTSIVYEYTSYLYQTGFREEALKVLKDNLDRYPDDKGANRQYLALLYYEERWDDLLTESEAIIKKFPEVTDFMELKGIALVKKEQIKEAIEVYKRILQIVKGKPSAMVNPMAILGDLYYQMKDKKSSFAYYEKVLKIEPNNVPTLNNYAYYLSLEDKSLQRAYEMSKITVDKEPDNPTYLDTFAWILFKMGKYLEAKAIFKHAMLYGGKESAAILDHYAETLFKLKEFDLAFIYWDQAKALDSTIGIEQKIAERKKEMK